MKTMMMMMMWMRMSRTVSVRIYGRPLTRAFSSKPRRKRKKKNECHSGLDVTLPPNFKSWMEVREAIRQQARACGLGPTHFAECTPTRPERMQAYLEWIEKGMHGEMGYLSREDRVSRRFDPRIVHEGAQSIIVSSLFYWPGQSAIHDSSNSKERGLVSSYAWGDDYHNIFGARLAKLARWACDLCGGSSKWYVDTGAILERELAERSGLSFTGKNTLAIHTKYGSGSFLGSVFTTLPLPPDQPLKKSSYCGKCTKCQVACPTGALSVGNDYILDARKCISYLTIELKGSIPENLRPLMGNWIYGCDICQQVCPWNKFDWEGNNSPLWGRTSENISSPNLVELMQMSQEDFEVRFANTAVKRIGRDRLLRNVAVALGNSGDPSVIPVLQRAIENEGSLVREHALWAMTHIRNQNCKFSVGIN